MPYSPSKTHDTPFLTDAESRLLNPTVHREIEADTRSPRVPAPPLDRQQVAALDVAVVAADAAVAAADDRRREARSRRKGLSERLEQTRADAPREYQPLNEALVDALASDPTTQHNPADIADAASRQSIYRGERDAWQAQMDLIGQAIGKVDAEIAAIETDIADLRTAREGEWAAFLVAANDYLAGVLQERFVALRDEIIQPMLDLDALEIGGARLLGTTCAWRIDHDPSLALFRNVEAPNRFHGALECNRETVKLLDRTFHARRIVGSSEAIDRFRAALGATG